jgi:hypothetical protein
MKSVWLMRDSDGGVTKDCKAMLIIENYKNAHNGHGHGVSWVKPHEYNPKIKTHPLPQLQPKSASQHHLRCIYIG